MGVILNGHRPSKYIDKAIEEILNLAFAVTKQYLQVNEVEFENGKPKVERVDLNYADNLAAVYFPFKGERYFLQINLEKTPEIKVDFVHTHVVALLQLPVSFAFSLRSIEAIYF